MPRYDDYDDFDDYDIRIGRGRRQSREPDTGPRPHSGIGLASILCAVLAFVGYVVTFGALIAIEAGNNGPMQENSPEAVLIGLGILGSIGTNLLGLCLGIAGCFQSSRNIAFPIFGTVLNGIFLFGVGSLVILGIVAGG